jgi:multicomponent Na+:H+ antiporter subunit G
MFDILGMALIATGIGFFAAGSIGLLRLPDLFSRLHALTKADNLGLGLLCAGLALIDGSATYAVKLFLVWLLVLAASATAAHMMAQHTLRQDIE